MENSEKKFNRGIDITSNVYKGNLESPKKSATEAMKQAGEKAVNIFKNLDMFGKPITLKYNGQDVYKSFVGATLSVSALGSMLLFFIASFLLFIRRKSPSYSSFSQSQSIPDGLTLKQFSQPMDWIVGIDIFDKGNSGSMFNSTVFDLTVNFVQRDEGGVEKFTNSPLKYVNCNKSAAFNAKINMNAHSEKEENMTKTYLDYFKMYQNKTLTPKCFYLNEVENQDYNETTLSGSESDQTESYVEITISYCKKNTTNDCLPLDDIKEKLKDSFIVRYYFTEQRFFANDTLQNPIINYTGVYYFPIQDHFSKTYKMKVQNNSVQDSWNIFSTKPTDMFIFSYSTQELNIDYYQDLKEDSNLLKIQIKLDTIKNTYIRKFQNIQEFFIGVVGIMNGIWAGGSGLGKFLNTMLLRVDLINKSFFVINEEKSDVEKKANENLIEMSKLNKDSQKDPIIDSKSIDKTNRSLIGQSVKLHRINSKNGTSKIEHNDNINERQNSLVSRERSEEEEKLEQNETSKKEEKKDNSKGISNAYHNDYRLLLPTKKKKFSKFRMSLLELVFQMLPFCNSNKTLMMKKKIYTECGDIIEAFFDIERIVGLLREYQDLRTVVLSQEEYDILKMLTTPKIEMLEDDEVNIKKVQKLNVNEKELRNNYTKFVYSINRIIKKPYLSSIENNLLQIHRLTHLMKEET